MTFIAPRFSQRVQTHLLANFMKVPLPGTPVLLAVHGEPGTGKSYQLDRALSAARVYYQTISSSELESDNANDPAKLVRKTYLGLADEISRNGYTAGALVINDIDTALGDWGSLVQTTVNRQLVIGELQHICDYPSSVSNRPNLRVPIFITANDLTKLYGPLLRPGRAATFHWEPSQPEIVAMLAPLLPTLNEKEIGSFAGRVNSPSIAAHVDVIRSVLDEKLKILTHDFSSNISRARRGELNEFASPTLEELLRAAEQLECEQLLRRNYSGRA